MDENGETQTTNATVVVASSSRVAWSAGWYVVNGNVTITGGADCSGVVKLILADGVKLTIDGVADDKPGIRVEIGGNSFAVYGQNGQTGQLDVTGGKNGAGIGSGWGGWDAANITINGGQVTATGGEYGAGIGGGDNGAGLNIFVADDVILQAGLSANPTEVIPHASPMTDIASLLANKRYATAEVTYPGYLDQYGPAEKAQFDVWAATFGSRDPDGIHQNAFLLNVATNREAEAIAAFKIGSIAVTNGVADIELPKPLPPATTFNGIVWLQCATNLPTADWKDVESGRYIDEGKSFLRCSIDFEHTLTPGIFPAEPTGIKTLKVLAH